MAVDKLVDSSQLDSDLTSVANAIRAKSGGSSPLAFPAGFVSDIGNISGGGDPNENLIKRATNTLTRVDIDINGKELAVSSFLGSTSLVEAKVTNMHGSGSEVFKNCSNLETVVLADTPGDYQTLQVYILRDCAKLKTADFSDLHQMAGGCFYNDPLFDTLILRKPTITYLSSVNCFYNTKFAQGKAGGTIYIPKVLYDHLGDNSNLDYKKATNWSTVDGYGTITWAKIEGTTYETHYADGTAIS